MWFTLVYLTDQRGAKYSIESQCGCIAKVNTWMRVAIERRIFHSTTNGGCHRMLRLDFLIQLFRVITLINEKNCAVILKMKVQKVL